MFCVKRCWQALNRVSAAISLPPLPVVLGNPESIGTDRERQLLEMLKDRVTQFCPWQNQDDLLLPMLVMNTGLRGLDWGSKYYRIVNCNKATFTRDLSYNRLALWKLRDTHDHSGAIYNNWSSDDEVWSPDMLLLQPVRESMAPKAVQAMWELIFLAAPAPKML